MGKIFQIVDIKFKYAPDWQSYLCIYGREKNGEHAQIKVTELEHYFYVNEWSDEFSEGLNRTGSNYLKYDAAVDVVVDVSLVQGKSFVGYEETLRPLYKVNVKDHYLVRRAFKTYPNLEFFEADIDPVTRFMVDKNLVGMGWCEVPDGVSRCTAGQVMAVVDCESSNAPLRTLSFDIEVMARVVGQFPMAKSIKQPDDKNKSLMVVVGSDPIIQISTVLGVYGQVEPIETFVFVLDTCDHVAGATVCSHDCERDLLEDFFYYVRSVDVDFLSGYNSDSFDIPYVLDRAEVLGVPATFAKSQNAVTYMRTRTTSNQRGTSERVTYRMDGIVPLDVLTVIRNEHKLRSYKLNDVAEHFLGEKKNDMSYKLIPEMQRRSAETRAELARYCIQDSMLVHKLLDKLKIQINCIEMARVIGIVIYEVVTRGQTHKIRRKILQEVTPFREPKTIYIPTFRRWATEEGDITHVPLYDLLTTDVDAATAGSDKGYRGATVVSPTTGFYSDPVAVFDFASLYPSIMQNWNLSHDTLLKGPREDVPYHMTPNGFYFVDKDYYKGTVVTILTKLLAARKKAKKQMKDETDPFNKELWNGKQKALKVVCNTMYGQ